jgi:glucosamine kinase
MILRIKIGIGRYNDMQYASSKMHRYNVQPTKQIAMEKIRYFVGIDGGGSGTRALLSTVDGTLLGAGVAGPSGLMHGAENAWASIMVALRQAFAAAALELPALDQIALACGLAGANNAPWAAAFQAQAPMFAELLLVSDALTTLYGAFQGEPGVIIALGTGSVGLALCADGTRREVGGWGFPSGDEASGAWLGLRALSHAQQVADGRRASDSLAQAVLAFCGGGRVSLMRWGVQANQTAVAQLAPLVVHHAAEVPAAAQLMRAAGQEVAAMALALDEAQSMPIALCGGLAAAMQPYLPDSLLPRVIAPKADAAAGALLMAQQRALTEIFY